MVIDKEAGRRWRQRIREFLNTEWNPIGVAELAPDEYGAYTGEIAAMLRAGASDAELSDYLHWAETVHMGMPGDTDRLGNVVASIRSLGWIHQAHLPHPELDRYGLTPSLKTSRAK